MQVMVPLATMFSSNSAWRWLWKGGLFRRVFDSPSSFCKEGGRMKATTELPTACRFRSGSHV
jgi:hypothetical protein